MRVTGSVVFALIVMLCGPATASPVSRSGGEVGEAKEAAARPLVRRPGAEIPEDVQQRPEPTAIALLGVGFALSVVLHRCRRGRGGVSCNQDPRREVG